MASVLKSSTKTVTVNLPKTPWNNGIPSNSTLDQQLESARESARAITATQGIDSPDSAVAWDIVEELLAAKAHRRAKGSPTSFDLYCQEYPEAPEALMYDV